MARSRTEPTRYEARGTTLRDNAVLAEALKGKNTEATSGGSVPSWGKSRPETMLVL